MSTKYKVEHEGFTFTRTTKNRTYTHVVLERRTVRQDHDEVLKSSESYWKINVRYYTDLANGLCRVWDLYPEQYTQEQRDAEVEYAKAWIANGKDGYVAARLAEFHARRALDPEVYYLAAGWCGRPDLAAKLASKTPNSIILEATPA